MVVTKSIPTAQKQKSGSRILEVDQIDFNIGAATTHHRQREKKDRKLTEEHPEIAQSKSLL
jgi:hypothetical protein